MPNTHNEYVGVLPKILNTAHSALY